MNESVSNEKRKCKILLKNLMDSVKECQNVYGKNKTLLATEKDVRFVLKKSYLGIKKAKSQIILLNIVELQHYARIGNMRYLMV